MTNAALIVANSTYASLSDLPCCHDDSVAIRELLEATKRFAVIKVIENVTADALKLTIRDVLDNLQSAGEIFFYYTGHGCQKRDEFYHCATDFDSSRPNLSGLSSSELHDLLRPSNAATVVKVIDACNSGTPLVKSDHGYPVQKDGFNNIIQISSCLDSQSAHCGESLSVFTEGFRRSVLQKREGIVYYSDIISALRDEFIQDNDQTPFFVSQGTARERFVDDAKHLDGLRQRFIPVGDFPIDTEDGEQEADVNQPTLRQLLEQAERKVATAEKIENLVNNLFDPLVARLSNDEFSEFFDMDVVEHADFVETTTEPFITRMLVNEERSDSFVTTEKRNGKTRRTFDVISGAFLYDTRDKDQRYREDYELRLNCDMKRAQIRITFNPKYHCLDQLVLVVTCAPSLERCFVFEVSSKHGLSDFGVFHSQGKEIVRRWYKLNWMDDTSRIVDKVSSKIREAVKDHLELTSKRLLG